MIHRQMIGFFMMVLSLTVFAAPEQCPQPRFTERAPDPDYGYINPLPADKDNLKAAKRLYLGKDSHFGCAKCHGNDGAGDGPLASQFNPRPRNFACAKTVNNIPDGQLFWIIRNGSPDTSMPAHPHYSDTEIWQLVLYLRYLAKP